MSDLSIGGDGGQVIMSGPIFSGQFAEELRQATMEADQELGDRAVELVQQRLDEVLQHPTGFYRSQINAAPRGDVVYVTDNECVYGPWLAGRGSRNAISVFKGYDHWDVAYQQLTREAPEVASRIIGQYIR